MFSSCQHAFPVPCQCRRLPDPLPESIEFRPADRPGGQVPHPWLKNRHLDAIRDDLELSDRAQSIQGHLWIISCLNQDALAEDLDAAWEVLAEPIQTVMRRFGVQGAYEQLKEVTRGQRVTPEALHGLIRSLEIPQDEKERLLAMTPASYVGKAAELARRV